MLQPGPKNGARHGSEWVRRSGGREGERSERVGVAGHGRDGIRRGGHGRSVESFPCAGLSGRDGHPHSIIIDHNTTAL